MGRIRFHKYAYHIKKIALMSIIYLLKGLPHQNMYAIFRCTENEIECSSKFERIVFVFTFC